MTEIVSGLAVWLGAALTVVIAIGGAWLRGKSSGKRDAETQAKAEQADAVGTVIRETANAENDVNRLPAGGAADRLRDKYSRD